MKLLFQGQRLVLANLRRIGGVALASAFCAAGASPASAFFLDGDGHYALRGVTETHPGFQKNTGMYQAIEQSFRLLGEARFNDNSSMYLEFRLFDPNHTAVLGDTAAPRDCAARTHPSDGTDSSEPCRDAPQNTGEPGYRPYTPLVTKAYVKYAFEYCIIEAGRRGRHWGLGLLMNEANGPFDSAPSIYDGVTCTINVQKSQVLGISVGYDKLSETGTYIDSRDRQDALASGRRRGFGPSDSSDDVDQYFFSIEYDDRKANAGARFTRNIGVYFAQVNAKSLKDGGSDTDLKFLDLYTGFYFIDFALRNEVVFRMGKSADPSWQRMGGAVYESGSPATNKLQSIGLAGDAEWTISRSGSSIGPTEYNAGDAARHVAFLQYAYAPGDSDGYLDERRCQSGTAKEADHVCASERQSSVTAMGFHSSYQPAMILFNGRGGGDELAVDGIFDPNRLLNTTLLGLGYRYESQKTGNFELKLLNAQLNRGAPAQLKTYFESRATDDGKRPVGYHGKNLGFELDMSYAYRVGREAEISVAGAAALPGDAWKIDENSKPTADFLIQTQAAFRF